MAEIILDLMGNLVWFPVDITYINFYIVDYISNELPRVIPWYDIMFLYIIYYIL